MSNMSPTEKTVYIDAKYNFRPRDAIHVACTLENSAELICSFDKDFDEIKEIKRIEP